MQPSTYQINLDLPPEERYEAICKDFRDQLDDLKALFSEILEATAAPKLLEWLSRKLLRRVYSEEETREMKGISSITGVPIHLVVAYNTLLDVMSGCTSGAVNTSQASSSPHMAHFRTLDWHMEPLRKVMICAEYVRSGKVIARAVTYAGYVGVLTGVRSGLSISLNYRIRMDRTWWSDFLLGYHNVVMLLGYRKSISSILREYLLSPGEPASLDEIATQLSSTRTSPCYLTFATPSQALLVEKDRKSATIIVDDKFLAVTNHDVAVESWPEERWMEAVRATEVTQPIYPEEWGIREILEDSKARKDCVVQLYKSQSKRRTRSSEVQIKDIAKWLETQPVLNSLTHFSCIMDPSIDGGGLVWVQAYPEAIEDEAISPEPPLLPHPSFD